MSRPPRTSDPRTIITPDAFDVDASLLGFPLASPGRRLAAILVDVVIIGLLTTLPGILLGIVGAALFFRIWGKSDKGDPLARAFKWTMGCFGAFVLFVTLTVVAFVAGDFFEGDARSPSGEQAAEEVAEGEPPEDVLAELDLGDIVRNASSLMTLTGPLTDLERAETPEEALAAAEEMARRLRELGLALPRIRRSLEEVVGVAPVWGDPTPVIDEALASLEPGRPETPEPGTEPEAAEPVFTGQALDSFAALRSRIAEVEADRADLRDELGDTRDELRRTREEAEGGFLSGLWSFADDLGLGFGWGSVYLTILLTWWKGQTVGKRLLNIRVLRLDGEPISWFVAFERAGGYAAGFATGLLGFAQIWWDPNRQAIHDKIVGTVVIRDGVDRVSGPWMLDEKEKP